MIISERTKISLSQLLDLLNPTNTYMLFKKHSIVTRLDKTYESWGEVGNFNLSEILQALINATPNSIEMLIDEVARTQGDLRSQANPKYIFEERWKDFDKWLLLDGFKIDNKEILRLEP